MDPHYLTLPPNTNFLFHTALAHTLLYLPINTDISQDSTSLFFFYPASNLRAPPPPPYEKNEAAKGRDIVEREEVKIGIALVLIVQEKK